LKGLLNLEFFAFLLIYFFPWVIIVLLYSKGVQMNGPKYTDADKDEDAREAGADREQADREEADRDDDYSDGDDS
jgi:hypothetical protein